MAGVRLIQISAVYMVLGLGLGLLMGVSKDFSLSSVHAHTLLLGWATMAITGVVYLMIPACAKRRLAMLHFWGHNIGLPVMMAGLAFRSYGRNNAEPAIVAGSMLVLFALVLFAVNVLKSGANATVLSNQPSLERGLSH
jgi:hypothetical protein